MSIYSSMKCLVNIAGLLPISSSYTHRHTGQGGAAAPPPSLVRSISYSGNLYSRVGQSSCSCFVSVIFLIFSFHLSLAPCIKTHTKTQEMALKRLYFSKFSWRACSRTPLEILAPLARVGQIPVYPPKFLSPYAYAYTFDVVSVREEYDIFNG